MATLSEASQSTSSSIKVLPTSTLDLTVTSTRTQVETASTLSTITTAPPAPASATSPGGANAPLKHEIGQHPLAVFLLPVVVVVAIPVVLLAMFFLYRRTCPNHYATTEPYCPFRYVARKAMNWPYVGPVLKTHEKNKPIRHRQREYMSRRSRNRSWRTSLTDYTTTSSSSRTEKSPAGKKSMEMTRVKGSRRGTLTDKDEWLRQDMLQHYGGRFQDQGIPPLPSSPTSPSFDNTTHPVLRSPMSQEEIDSYKFMPPRTPPPARPLPLTPEEELRNYVPGRLTGDQPDVDQSSNGNWRIFPMHSGIPDLRSVVKAAREQHMKDRSSANTFQNAANVVDCHVISQLQQADQVVNVKQPLITQGGRDEDDLVPPIPPRSSNRGQQDHHGI